MIRLKAVGDIMPGGIFSGQTKAFLDTPIRDYLEDADVRIGTLECALGNEPTFCSEKRKKSGAFVYARDNDVLKLSMLGISAVSLANNHFFDLGLAGAANTIALLEKNGIGYFGAGMNIEQARRPFVYTKNGQSVAFLGFCDTRLMHLRIAGDSTPGINPMTEDNVSTLIKDAKSKYDYVVAVVHWGKEHTYWPLPHVVKIANVMQKAGVSLILGDHPHRIQSICRIKNTPVAFSLGNFLFPDRLINKPYVTYYPEKPENENYDNYEQVIGFVRVEKPTLKIWREVSNTGMVLDVVFSDKKVKVDYQLSKIDRKGFVSFMTNNRDRRRIDFYSHFICMKIYPSIYFLFNVIRKFIKRVKKICKRTLK